MSFFWGGPYLSITDEIWSIWNVLSNSSASVGVCAHACRERKKSMHGKMKTQSAIFFFFWYYQDWTQDIYIEPYSQPFFIFTLSKVLTTLLTCSVWNQTCNWLPQPPRVVVELPVCTSTLERKYLSWECLLFLVEIEIFQIQSWENNLNEKHYFGFMNFIMLQGKRNNLGSNKLTGTRLRSGWRHPLGPFWDVNEFDSLSYHPMCEQCSTS